MKLVAWNLEYRSTVDQTDDEPSQFNSWHMAGFVNVNVVYCFEQNFKDSKPSFDLFDVCLFFG